MRYDVCVPCTGSVMTRDFLQTTLQTSMIIFTDEGDSKDQVNSAGILSDFLSGISNHMYLWAFIDLILFHSFI